MAACTGGSGFGARLLVDGQPFQAGVRQEGLAPAASDIGRVIQPRCDVDSLRGVLLAARWWRSHGVLRACGNTVYPSVASSSAMKRRRRADDVEHEHGTFGTTTKH